MADEKQSGTGAGGNNLVLLAIAAVSAVYFGWQKPALETFRPTEAERQVHSIGDVQNIDARLWQDPFGAIAQYLNDAPQPKTTQSTRYGVSEFIKQLKGSEPLVIGVTLPGGRYPVEVEERRRLRYAVAAALHTAKYVPEDAEHIGYLRIDGGQKGDQPGPAETVVASADPADTGLPAKGDDPPPVQMDVPFEWFSHLAKDKAKTPRIAVLWLDESVLRKNDRPIGRLKRFAKTLQLAPERFVLLGPHDSTTLTAMVREIGSPAGGVLHSPFMTMINFAATADDGEISRRAGLDKADEADEVHNIFSAAGVRYFRAIPRTGFLPTHWSRSSNGETWTPNVKCSGAQRTIPRQSKFTQIISH
jgi:hypothetical protein